MRGSVVALVLLVLLVVAQEGRGEGNTIRLCGRDFIRAVVFTCGGSRWRRHLSDYHHLFASSSFDAAESDNPLPFSQENKGYADSSPQAALETDSEEIHEVQPGTEWDSWHSRKTSALKKREDAKLLTTSCCSIGCTEREIRSLC